MTDFEKAEKIIEKTKVTFSEAKEALDNTDGELLSAIIYLENAGKIAPPAGGGEYSGAPVTALVLDSEQEYSEAEKEQKNGNDFSELMKKFGAFCLKIFNAGLSNFLEAKKGEQHLFSCPVLVVALLLIFFFWITLPLFVVSLFCGFKYKFTGKHLGKDSVNDVMDNASTAAQEVKKNFCD